MSLAIALNDKNNKFSNKENKYTAAKYYHMGLTLDYKAYTRYHQDTYGWVVFMVSRNYLNLIANEHDSITMNKYILGGMPAIKGTRIPVSLILSCFRDNMKISEICEDYHLTEEQVIQSIEYTIDVLNRSFYEE